jgi:dolichol-phosphate mannosyltransferase
VMLFMFGILFLGLGIMGEYIWRNLEESRKRPLFLIDSEYGLDSNKDK